MDEVQKKVEEILDICLSIQIALYYGITPDDIPFAVLVTRGLWYKIRIIANFDGRQIYQFQGLSNYQRDLLKHNSDSYNKFDLNLNNNEKIKITVRTGECLTKRDALNCFHTCIKEIENGCYSCLFPKTSSKEFKENFYFFPTLLPADAVTNPDKYLNPGDVIERYYMAGSYHCGIYIGKGEVAHVSGHDGGKSVSRARVGKLCPYFAKNGESIRKLVFSYSIRSPERIVEIAKQKASERFRDGEYCFIDKNCQHFVTLCVLGLECWTESAMVTVNTKPSMYPYSNNRKSQKTKTVKYKTRESTEIVAYRNQCRALIHLARYEVVRFFQSL